MGRPGANKPISGTRRPARRSARDEQLAQIADELGVSENEAAAAVAQVLPAVVDAITPHGELPPPLDRLRALQPRPSRSFAYNLNSPRATVTACPPTSTRSISPSPPSARA